MLLRRSGEPCDGPPARPSFTGTHVLTTTQARGLGTLGYVARASGIDIGRHLGDLLTVPTRTARLSAQDGWLATRCRC
jgi:hypothetical protein